MTSSRVGFLSWAVSVALISCIYASLGYVTFFFGRPALAELWHHGYTAGVTTTQRPEWNLITRFFMSDYGVHPPADIARTEFNQFLRCVTVPMMFFVPMMASSIAAAGIATERVRETWSSLIATPLTARDILRGKILSALWQMALDADNAARPVDDRPDSRGDSPAGVSRHFARAGRVDLADACVWHAGLDPGQGRGRRDRPERASSRCC